ncbi:hypothetical protein M3Y97_01154800 [Aphelenchoides bicaudatus]|nr:hypothetical protein M3Y97_01154800 [Aphelenchoides bicaudatus]
MSETSPNKAQTNGPSPGRSTRQSRRIRGQTPVDLTDSKSPRLTPTRDRTSSQTSIGSTGSKGRRQRATSFASSNGSRHDDEDVIELDGDSSEHKKNNVTTPKKSLRKRRRSMSFNDSGVQKTGDKVKQASSIESLNDQNESINLSPLKLNESVNLSPLKLNDSQKQPDPKKNMPTRKQQKQSGSKRVAESHAELFKQSILSKDFEKFSTILRNLGNDVPSKKATIQDLDASLIIPTLKYINEVFRDDSLRERTTYMRDFRATIDFMEMLLQVHSGYLSTLKNLDKLLGGLVEFAQSRTANIEKLNQLEGRISFVHDQMRMRVNPTTFSQQKEEVFYDDTGRHMKRAAAQQLAGTKNTDEQMDT